MPCGHTSAEVYLIWVLGKFYHGNKIKDESKGSWQTVDDVSTATENSQN